MYIARKKEGGIEGLRPFAFIAGVSRIMRMEAFGDGIIPCIVLVAWCSMVHLARRKVLKAREHRPELYE